MSEDEAAAVSGIIVRAGLCCAAVRLRAYGATWEVVGEFLRSRMPPAMTLDELRTATLDHLERERTA